MRVQLVKPNNLSDHIQPSLGLAFLAEGIKDKHAVEIVDCIKEDIAHARFAAELDRFKPDIVGIQCYTFDLRNVVTLLKAIKDHDPNIVTIVGGAHISSDPRRALEHLGDNCDFCLAGEGEIGFPKFVDAIERGETDFSDVPGLLWWKDGELLENPQEMVQDLDSLGYPAWELICPEHYPESQHGAFYEKFPIAPIITTRGCPYSCTFCSAPILSGKKLRHHSREHVIGEIRMLYEERGIREFHIVDDNFTFDIDYAKDILRGIKELNYDIALAMPNGIRMDRVDDELLELMKECGLYIVSVAVESGNDRILKKMKKATTKAKIRENVDRIHRHGLRIAAFFILGFPTETEEEMKETIKLAYELPFVRANFFTYLPLPGTESYRELEESGEIGSVDWLNFYFMSAAYVPKGMTRERLLKIKRNAFLGFYLRPKQFWFNLRSIKSRKHLGFLLKRLNHWVVQAPKRRSDRRRESEAFADTTPPPRRQPKAREAFAKGPKLVNLTRRSRSGA
jgi:anaerobic magnesium-protoporphyrin IX monomethyl ester cyclase